MIVCIDNDILEKAVRLSLLNDIEILLDCSRDEIHVLPTARFRYGARDAAKALRKIGPSAPVLLEYCEKSQVAGPTHIQDAALLASVVGIDEGELQLMSLAARTDGAMLVTGDKRSLCALAGVEAATDLINRLSGKVICLEQLIARAIKRRSFAVVLPGLVLGCECDRCVQACVGSGLSSVQATVEDNLSSYIGDLRRKTGQLLADS